MRRHGRGLRGAEAYERHPWVNCPTATVQAAGILCARLIVRG